MEEDEILVGRHVTAEGKDEILLGGDVASVGENEIAAGEVGVCA